MLEIKNYRSRYDYLYQEGFELGRFEGAISCMRRMFRLELKYRERIRPGSDKKPTEEDKDFHETYYDFVTKDKEKREVLESFFERYWSLSDRRFAEIVFRESEYWPINYRY